MLRTYFHTDMQAHRSNPSVHLGPIKHSCAFMPLLVCLRNLQEERDSAVCGGWTVCTHFNHSWINSPLLCFYNLSLCPNFVQLNSVQRLCFQTVFSKMQQVVCGRITQFNVGSKVRAWTVSEPCRWEPASLCSDQIKYKTNTNKRQTQNKIHQEYKGKKMNEYFNYVTDRIFGEFLQWESTSFQYLVQL